MTQEPSAGAAASAIFPRSVRSEPLMLDEKTIAQSGSDLSMSELHVAIAQGFGDIRAGRAGGGKAVYSLPEAVFWEEAGHGPRPPQFVGERLGWKLSCLYSANSRHAGVKVIGANAFNRKLGLARSRSTFILMEKFSMQPIAILDATGLSAARTGVYASTVLELCPFDADAGTVFLFGAGPIARQVLLSLAHAMPTRIARVFLRARSPDNARIMARALSPHLPFELVAVDDNRHLPASDFVITATNADRPVFADQDLRRDACLLHLGGDEVPEETLRRILRQGHLGCDDLATVSRRNSQSLALMFSRAGTTLEALGPHLGILQLSKPEIWPREAGVPLSVTCVGLPMLDLYAAAAIYEKYLTTL
ncbi:MAG: ornithine cyclodeaminase [Rhizobiaceae bacterium]|nr:ornithine cyclodeaminase [Rhizobiaceae bacterium]